MHGMARRDISRAFGNNHHLQQFMLTDVTPTGKVLGTGSYGSVEEVKYRHLMCAGKKLHEILLEAGNVGVPDIVRKYEQECQLMSNLRHPNITLFLGLCFLPGTRLPLLVMERLETSLDDLLEHMPGLPLSLKRSVLEDVASGLVYLHENRPPVIHRDLTTNNILLTSSLVAKISDMGNSRIIDMRPGQLARTLSRLPGTQVYMPPEAMDETHRYGPSLDIFSFGHLSLYTIIQVFPGNLLASTFPDPDNPGHVVGRTEVERRAEYIELLEKEIGNHYPSLVQLIKQCLHNAPEERPATDEVLNQLQRLKVEVEGVYGGNFTKLDIDKVLLAKEMKMKDRRIEELEERFEAAQERADQLAGELEISRERQEQLQLDIEDHVRQLQQKQQQMDSLRVEMDDREARLREELLSEMEEMRRCQELPTGQGLLKLEFPLRLNWRRGPDMPCAMWDSIQSVVLQDTVYIGGGRSNDKYIVMEYNTRSGKWGRFPPYTTSSFAMTAIDNQLVLVGGRLRGGSHSKALGMWKTDSKKWTHPYPAMSITRYAPSAATYKEWLVVVGGYSDQWKRLSSVEVMNTNSKQWYTAAPAPTALTRMKTATVGDMCYFMGGFDNGDDTDVAYSVSLPALISQVDSKEKDSQIWKMISGLGLYYSTPLSIGGSLLALGGLGRKDGKVTTAIHHYRPETGKWVKVGDLSSPRIDCACGRITGGGILVAGGEDGKTKLISTELGKLFY